MPRKSRWVSWFFLPSAEPGYLRRYQRFPRCYRSGWQGLGVLAVEISRHGGPEELRATMHPAGPRTPNRQAARRQAGP
jgi:hypothetical protein